MRTFYERARRENWHDACKCVQASKFGEYRESEIPEPTGEPMNEYAGYLIQWDWHNSVFIIWKPL